MDASVANELIAKPGQNQESDQGYEKRRVEMSRSLVRAAENITYGDAERVPIQTRARDRPSSTPSAVP